MNNKNNKDNTKISIIIYAVSFLLIIVLVTFIIWNKITAIHMPIGMSQETYDIGVQALKIMDKYNDVEIDADNAAKRLEILKNNLEELDYNYGSTHEENNLLVELHVSSFLSSLDAENGNEYNPCKEANELRKLLQLN